MLLTKDQILGADDIVTKEINVPQWGGSVKIRTMTASDRDRFEQQVFSGNTKSERRDNIRALMLSICIVDESGNRVFGEKDVKALGGKSAAAVDAIFSEIQKMNALSDADIDEAAKNSEGTLGDVSDGE